MKFTNKKVLMRVEFNVPLTKSGQIADDSRIVATLPSINKILEDKPKQLILMFHLGRPKNCDANLSSNKVAERLGELLKRKVVKVNHCGEIDIPDNYKIVVLENLRFYSGEKAGDVKFSKRLASLADVYVNESFGTSHRKDSSVYVIPKFFEKKNRCMGLLLKNEVKKLSLVEKSKNLTVIVGFAKISDKITFLEKLLKKSEKVLIGGLVIFTFLKAQGLSVGDVKVDDLEVKIAQDLLKKYGGKIITPVDFKGRDKLGKLVCVPFDQIPSGFIGYDLGPKSIQLFCESLRSSKLVFWNGPLGRFEVKPFDKSTNEISKFLADNNRKIKTVIGGGDTAFAIKKSGYGENMYHISTGGGASLMFIEKGALPALKWF